MPLILPGNVASALPTGFNVDNSCRFNDGDSAYIYRDLGTSTAGSGKKFTFSVWVKRSTISNTDQFILSCGVAASNHLVDLFFQSDDTLKARLIYGNTLYGNLTTNAVYRDTASWMHIVINMDTTQGTAADRTSMYVNGTKITSFSASTRPNQDSTFTVNNNTVNSQRISLGRNEDGTTGYFDGYMAEAIWIDGTTYAASNFGEYDEDSPQIWKPKDCKDDLTFGTHGSYLNFQDSGDLDDDESGNGLDFTATNLTATDQTTDTPTNNFCTLNPLIYTPNPPTFSEGNTKFVKSTTGVGHGSDTIGTMGVKSGKWYWEMKTVSSTSFQAGMIGDNHNNANSNGDIGGSNIHIVIPDNTWGDNKNNNGTTTSITLSYSANDIFGFAHDLDNGKWYFHINGTYHDSGDPTSGSSGTGSLGNITTGTLFYLPYAGGGSYNHQHTFEFNFGNAPFSISSGNADANGYGNFEYAVPSGYYALCTKNLAEYG